MMLRLQPVRLEIVRALYRIAVHREKRSMLQKPNAYQLRPITSSWGTVTTSPTLDL